MLSTAQHPLQLIHHWRVEQLAVRDAAVSDEPVGDEDDEAATHWMMPMTSATTPEDEPEEDEALVAETTRIGPTPGCGRSQRTVHD